MRERDIKIIYDSGVLMTWISNLDAFGHFLWGSEKQTNRNFKVVPPWLPALGRPWNYSKVT